MKKIIGVILFLFLINGVYGVNVTQCGALTQSNTTYDLMNNVSSSGTCFLIQASNFTFNLNGHTINYAQSQTGYAFYDNWSNRDNVTITNGTLIGGNNYGSHAIYTQSDGSDNLNFNNLNITVNGNETSAIRLNTGSSVTISNNTINTQSLKNDPCSHYGGWATIELSHVGGKIDIHDNTITGKGMAGIQMSLCGTFTETAKIYNNYVRMWSAVRDGYAIAISGGNNSCSGGTQIFNNTIDQENGRGIIIDGWNSGAYGPGNIEIFENDVTVREGYDCEYNAAGTAIGLRARFGAHDLDIHDNIFKGFAGLGVADGSGSGDGAEVEGSNIGAQEPYGQNIKFHDNIIEVSTNNANYSAIGIYVSGGTTSQDSAQSYYYNNTITSNNKPIVISYNDGVGTDATFTSNTVIQGVNPFNYHAVWLGWWIYTAKNIDFVDLKGVNATSHTDLFFEDQASNYDVNFSWFMNVQVNDSLGNPLQNANVEITNGLGSKKYGTTNSQGKFTGIVEEVIYSGSVTGTGFPAATNYNSYSVKATYNGQTQTQSNITMNQSKTINFQFTLTPCTNGQTRDCTTTEDCDGTQTCTAGVWGTCNDIPNDGCPAECQEDWSCTIWSACVDGQQTRTCTDNNDCGTTDNKPAETQDCGECTNGATQDCTTNELCPGTQTCINNLWGNCMDIPNDGCPLVLGNISVEQVNPANDINVTKNMPFTFTTTVTCNAGICGDVTAVLDPQIVFQEGTGNYSTTYDARLRSGRTNNGTETSLRVHNMPIKTLIIFPEVIGNNSGQIAPGSIIESAELELTLESTEYYLKEMGVYRVTDSDNDGVPLADTETTYENRRNGVPWNTAGGDYESTPVGSFDVQGNEPGGTKYTVDVTQAVQYWADNYNTKNDIAQGFIIIYDTGWGDTYFRSSEYSVQGDRPKLTIQYTDTGVNTKGQVSTNSGATPFYTTNNNPQTCSDMLQGETCTNNWNVIPTGTTGETYSFYVTYTSEHPEITEQNTPTINITITEETACEEDWTCTIWGECIDGQQTRTCTDNNDCGTTDNKPYETQDCGECTNGITQNCTTNELCPGTQTCINNLWGTCTDIPNDNCPAEPECEAGQIQKCYTTEDCQGTQACVDGFWGLCNKLPNHECINCSNPNSYTCGDLDLSGSMPDISDLIYLVNYLFMGGPEPVVDCSANVDGEGSIEVSDLIYMVNYMFQNGPEMQCTEVN